MGTCREKNGEEEEITLRLFRCPKADRCRCSKRGSPRNTYSKTIASEAMMKEEAERKMEEREEEEEIEGGKETEEDGEEEGEEEEEEDG